jgi:hypothetical protein
MQDMSSRCQNQTRGMQRHDAGGQDLCWGRECLLYREAGGGMAVLRAGMRTLTYLFGTILLTPGSRATFGVEDEQVDNM